MFVAAGSVVPTSILHSLSSAEQEYFPSKVILERREEPSVPGRRRSEFLLCRADRRVESVKANAWNSFVQLWAFPGGLDEVVHQEQPGSISAGLFLSRSGSGFLFVSHWHQQQSLKQSGLTSPLTARQGLITSWIRAAGARGSERLQQRLP